MFKPHLEDEKSNFESLMAKNKCPEEEIGNAGERPISNKDTGGDIPKNEAPSLGLHILCAA